MLKEVKSQKKLTKNKIVVGILDDYIVKFLEKEKVPIYTKEIYLNSKGLSHLARDSKKQRGAGLSEEDILRIPEILSTAKVYFDDEKDKLNLLFCDTFSKRCIKLVVDTKYIRKKDKLTLIKTAGYIEEANLKAYKKIKKDEESR